MALIQTLQQGLFYLWLFSEIMAVTVRTEVKEEFVPLDVKVEMAEGDAALEFNQDANAAVCIGNHECDKNKILCPVFLCAFWQTWDWNSKLTFHISAHFHLHYSKNEEKYKKTRTSRSFKVSNWDILELRSQFEIRTFFISNYFGLWNIDKQRNRVHIKQFRRSLLKFT